MSEPPTCRTWPATPFVSGRGPAPVVRILRPVLRGAGLIKNSSQQSLILLISVSFHCHVRFEIRSRQASPRNSLGDAFGVRSLTPAPVVRILRPVLRGAGLIKSSSQQSMILLIYSSFHLSCEI